jgi:D-apionate oxidoisomerase
MNTIALLGAGGKIGLRITDNLLKTSHRVRYVEVSEDGKAALERRGVIAAEMDEECIASDVIVLALPENRIGPVVAEFADRLKPGAMLIALNIAAPLAGALPKRDDLAYFVAHPCHPSVFGCEMKREAQLDFLGGVYARQNIVCSLVQGPEDRYMQGEALARAMYAPVERCHRCTPIHMAMLEPVLSQTVLGTCLTIVREAMDEAVWRGVSEETARDFLLGHLKAGLGVVFQLFEEATFSDGALKAIEAAQERIVQPDWKSIFETESIMQSVRQISGATRTKQA